MFNQGQIRRHIADNLDVHYGTVCHWIHCFEKGGKTGLELGQRGRCFDEDCMLIPVQEVKLKQIICDKNLQQMKLPFAFWNSVVI